MTSTNTQSTTRRFARRLSFLVALAMVALACGGAEPEATPPEAGEDEAGEDEAGEDEAGEDEAGEDEAGEDEAGDTAGDPDEPVELREIVYGLGTTSIGPAQSPYTSLPLALGFWEEEGLDVEVIGFPGGSASLQGMDAGHVEMTFTGTPSYFVSLESGETDWVATYAQVATNIFQPAVTEDSPIQSLADLEGTTIGVPGLEFSVIPIVTAAMRDEGLDPDTIDWIVVGAGAEALAALEAGRIDALGMFDAPYAEIENLGQPLRLITNDDIDNIGFHNTLVAWRDTVENDPDLIVGIARGVAKATLFASENPEAATRIHWELYPESRATGVSEEEALAQGIRHLVRRSESTVPVEGLWGFSTDEQIQNHLNLMITTGQMNESWTVEDVWYDGLIDEINDFDRDAIVEMANNWQP